MKQREFLYFEWSVIDKCNMSCSYCINNAGKGKDTFDSHSVIERRYISGYEVEIAKKIFDVSKYANKTWVSLTGGEALMADHIIEAISILGQAPNITIRLITNLKRIDIIKEKVPHLLPRLIILGSLHVSYRSDKDVDKLINFIKCNKSQLNISLTQVDYNLSPEDRRKLSRIEEETGLRIAYQTYLLPQNLRSKNQDHTNNGKSQYEKISKTDSVVTEETLNENRIITMGKRCCLGYSHFVIKSDATLAYDLWCTNSMRKTINFLEVDSSKIIDYLLDDMKKCQKKNCFCNYNIINHDEYLAACKRLGYTTEEIFESNHIIKKERKENPINVKGNQFIMKKLSFLKNHIYSKVKGIPNK